MRLVIQFSNGNYCNIPADRLAREDALISVFFGDKLMGIIDLAAIEYMYLFEVKGDSQ